MILPSVLQLISWTFILSTSLKVDAQRCEDSSTEIEEVHDCGNFTQGSCSENISLECFTWCKSFQVEVIDSNRGVVQVTLPRSLPGCCHDCYSIRLFHLDQDDDGTCNSTEPMQHSNIPSLPLALSENELLVKFEYVYSGCYMIRVTPHREGHSRESCDTNPFEVNTTYQKKMPSSARTIIPHILNREEHTLIVPVDFRDTFADGNLPRIATVKLSSGPDLDHQDCSQMGSLQSCCRVDLDIPAGQTRNTSVPICHCFWRDFRLECLFSKVQDGSYCVEIELEDTRCTSDTLWTVNASYCMWHAHLTVNSSTSPNIEVTGQDSLLLSLLCIFVTVGILGLLIYFYLRHFLRGLISEKGLIKESSYNRIYNGETQVNMTPTSRIKVLLLYPRDCPAFMRAMATFREIIDESNNLKVYDTWDPEQRDHIAANIATWHMSFLNEPDNKVVLVANPCSRTILKNLLLRHPLGFTEPHSFDRVFPSALDCVLSKGFDYRRVFVIRLDGDDFDEQKFDCINPTTVFTIPQQLESLRGCLQNLELGELNDQINSRRISALKQQIEDLNIYKRENPNYLSKLLSMDVI